MKTELHFSDLERAYKAKFTIEEGEVVYSSHDLRSEVFNKLTHEIAKKIMESVDITFKKES